MSSGLNKGADPDNERATSLRLSEPNGGARLSMSDLIEENKRLQAERDNLYQQLTDAQHNWRNAQQVCMALEVRIGRLEKAITSFCEWWDNSAHLFEGLATDEAARMVIRELRKVVRSPLTQRITAPLLDKDLKK